MATPQAIPEGNRIPHIYPTRFWSEEESKTAKVKAKRKFKIVTKDDLGNDVERDETREILVDEVQYEMVDYVEWVKKGDPKTSQVIKIKFMQRLDPEGWKVIKPYYEAWKKEEEMPVDGTPLANWPLIKSKRILDQLRMISVFTVEDLAALPDSFLHNVGMGARELRNRAKAYVEMKRGDAEKAVLFAEQNAKLEEQALQIAELTKNLENLTRNLPQREKPEDFAKGKEKA